MFYLLGVGMLKAQFAPPVGQAGTTAMHKDSSAFIAWATNCTVVRGWQDISQTALGTATVGAPADATGQADGSGVVSLGDGGYAILQFPSPITNGPGFDFAVFENSFNAGFLELAFVEVSSDGTNYARFPASCLHSQTQQIGPFDNTGDATKINNLAGKYVASYGTPFDLQDLQTVAGTTLDINAIRYVKVIDVVGSITPQYATRDKDNRLINDPWPTAFGSSGFDLDGVGVIHQQGIGLQEFVKAEFKLFPSVLKAGDALIIEPDKDGFYDIELVNTQGQVEEQKTQLMGRQRIELTNILSAGMYFMRLSYQNGLSQIKKLLVQ